MASSKAYKFSTGKSFEAGSVQLSDFPWNSLAEVKDMFSYGHLCVSTHFREKSETDNSDEIDELDYSNLNTDDATKLVNGINTMIREASWPNISSSEISIEFSRFQLSREIHFDAVTFELPVETSIMDKWLYGLFPGDGDHDQLEFYASEICNEHACVLPIPSNLQDQVRIIELCSSQPNGSDEFESFSSECAYNTKSSALIYSFGHYIAIDTLQIATDDDSSQIVQAENVRK